MLLNIEHLSKSYGSSAVLDDLSLSVHENELIGLLGPNGSGKSTLIKCINDLVIPDTGTVEIDGLPPQAATRALVAYLPEKSCLDPSWTGKDAIRFFASFYPDFDAQKAERLAEHLDLSLDQELRSMSKGMQEKLQIALIMARRARLYILDEPLGGVDPLTRDLILDTVLRNFEDGSSMIISTHMIADLERILDRAVFLKHGRIVLDESADALRESRGKSIDAIYREVFSK